MMHRRRLVALTLMLPAALAGCGWQPLYADAETGLGDADLRAIRVDPIADRIGQNLEIALRDGLNPQGIPTPPRFELATTLQTTRSDLSIQSQGLATRGQVDVIATFVLSSLPSHKQLLKNTIHVNDSFDILASGYATVVTENDAFARTVTELQREIIARLTMYMQRRPTRIGASF